MTRQTKRMSTDDVRFEIVPVTRIHCAGSLRLNFSWIDVYSVLQKSQPTGRIKKKKEADRIKKKKKRRIHTHTHREKKDRKRMNSCVS